jgi:hypothetical protein
MSIRNVLIALGICLGVVAIIVGVMVASLSAGDSKKEAAPVTVLIDIPALLESSKASVEQQYGPGELPNTVKPGTMTNFPQGGEDCQYIKPYLMQVFFENSGQVAGLFMLDTPSLIADEYGQWLPQLGFSSTSAPDERAPARLSWTYIDGHRLDVFMDPRSGEVYQINAWR